MSLPKRLGRYRIQEEVGRGAMGRVFLAHDPEIDRRVAIKTVELPAGLSGEEREAVLTRFQREIRAAGRLVHANIVTIYDMGRDPGGEIFVAMEFVEGRSLGMHTRPGQLLDFQVATGVIVQAAQALAYAHRQGIVHRDIKPANLLLLPDGQVKIADFGLAKHIGTSMTTDGMLVGSPNYMSPEQIRGEAVDGRSDLFSLAVAAYELFTGRVPFPGEAISTVIYRILNEPPAEPQLGRIDAAPRVRDFLIRALAKRPEERYGTGDLLATALQEASAGSGAPIRPESPRAGPAASRQRGQPEGRRGVRSVAGRAAKPAPPLKRRRHLVTGGIVLVLAGIAAAAWMIRPSLLASIPGLERRLPPLGREQASQRQDAKIPAAAFLSLTSEPSGAMFEADGRAVEGDRIPIPAPGESARVRAVLGCREASRLVTSADAGGAVVFQLQAARVPLRVTSDPPSAAVLVDDQMSGSAPLTLSLDSCTSHEIVVRKEGFKDWSARLELQDGRLQTSDSIAARLAPVPKGRLVVPTGPFPLEAVLDDGLRVKPGERVSVTAGRHSLLLRNADLLFRWESRLEVPADGVATPKPQFPGIARLTIRAQPGNAQIEISGAGGARGLGAPPIFGEQVAAGAYTVKCTFLHNGEVQAQNVTLVSGENPVLVFASGRP